MSAPQTAICPWCGIAFALPKAVHGTRQKFCCPGHRAAFWKAARRWVARAILSGLLTYDAVRVGGSAVYGSATRSQADDVTADV